MILKSKKLHLFLFSSDFLLIKRPKFSIIIVSLLSFLNSNKLFFLPLGGCFPLTKCPLAPPVPPVPRPPASMPGAALPNSLVTASIARCRFAFASRVSPACFTTATRARPVRPLARHLLPNDKTCDNQWTLFRDADVVDGIDGNSVVSGAEGAVIFACQFLLHFKVKFFL